MKKILIVILLFITISCSKIDFVYKTNKDTKNPLYGKTVVNTSGLKLSFMNSYIPKFFGESDDTSFDLSINLEEKRVKRSVEINQATSNLDYEIRFNYNLISIDKNCVVYKKDILSSFSIIPKSEGYNYGTDTSLEKKYELAVTENFNKFISALMSIPLDECK